MQIAVIGLGHMGVAMARRLLKAGHQLTVFNRTRDKALPLERQGARIAASAKEAAGYADVLVTMLSDDQAVLDNLLGDHGALAGLEHGHIHVSSSTIGVATSRRLAELHRQAGQVYVAAPVLGRPEAAEAGKLVVLAAGPADALECCQPLFDVIGESTHRLGDLPERANAAKLAANGVLATIIQAVGEAYALAEAYGLAPAAFLGLLNGSMLKSPVVGSYGKLVAEGKFEPAGFPLQLGLKDVRLAVEAAQAQGLALPLMDVVRGRLADAVTAGLADKDWSAVAGLAGRRQPKK